MPVFPPTRQPLFDLPALLLPTLAEIARGAPTLLSRFGARFSRAMDPSPRVQGTENIPPEKPFVLIFNHYESERVPAWWAPLLAGYLINAKRTREPNEVRLVMAQKWWYAEGWDKAIKEPFTRWLFARAAQVYGLMLVPPILEGFATRGEGVAGVRAALELTRGAHPQILGIAPEGRTGPGGVLCEPPPGTGLFLLLLTHDTIPCLPLGVFENGGEFTLDFGEPFQFNVPRSRDRDQRDYTAATQAMQQLAARLPPQLRGPYSTSK